MLYNKNNCNASFSTFPLEEICEIFLLHLQASVNLMMMFSIIIVCFFHFSTIFMHFRLCPQTSRTHVKYPQINLRTRKFSVNILGNFRTFPEKNYPVQCTLFFMRMGKDIPTMLHTSLQHIWLFSYISTCPSLLSLTLNRNLIVLAVSTLTLMQLASWYQIWTGKIYDVAFGQQHLYLDWWHDLFAALSKHKKVWWLPWSLPSQKG